MSEKKLQNKIRNKFFLEKGIKAYNGIIADGDKIIWKDEYVNWLENNLYKHICKHKNEVMRQGDGFIYVTCGDCGEEL